MVVFVDIVYFGNDVNDLLVMWIVGWLVVVVDVYFLVCEEVWVVLMCWGGDGVVWEFVECVLLS